MSCRCCCLTIAAGLAAIGFQAMVQPSGDLYAAQLIPIGDSSTSWTTIDSPVGGTSGWTQGVLSTPAPASRLVPLNDSLHSPTPNPANTGENAPVRTAWVPPLPPPLLSPSLGGGQPTGYVGRWGDYFISGSAATAGNLRDGVPDGSINLGMGFGDPIRAVGLDVSWGIGSIQQFGSNGGFSASIGRVLVNQPSLQVSVAGGLLDAVTYGFEPDQEDPADEYGAITVATPLRPGDPNFQQVLQFTAGVGGKRFAAIDSNFEGPGTGFFAAAGVEVTPNLGASLGWSGRSTNVNLSYIPFRAVPIFVNLLAADVFNSTPYGTIGVLSVGWGDNFRTGSFVR